MRRSKQTGDAQTGQEDCERTQYGVLANRRTSRNGQKNSIRPPSSDWVLQKDVGTQIESQNLIQRRRPQDNRWMDGESC
jgi:hypothetical protein